MSKPNRTVNTEIQGIANEPDFLKKRVDDYYRTTKLPRHVLIGRQLDEGAIRLASSDYLALTNHPKIINSHMSELTDHGHGALMSPVFVKEADPQRKLELRFAALVGMEDVGLCQSGWVANYGLMKNICSPKVPVYLDFLAHSSLWEGVNASGAKICPFKHNDLNHLETLINKHGPGIVAVDSLYSNNGDICPLVELVDLVEKTGCVVVVDEAHSFGVYGERGEGMVASLGLSNKVHFITFSLAKAFSGRGGLVASSARNVDFFCFTPGPFLFSSKVMQHEIASFNETLNVVMEENWRREQIHNNSRLLRSRLAEIGFPVIDSDSHVLALDIGPVEYILQLRNELEKRGVFGSIFGPPATLERTCLLRFSLNANVTQEQIEKVVKACAEAYQVLHKNRTDSSTASMHVSEAEELVSS